MAKHRVCPWWMGFVLASSLRKVFHHPGKILGPHVREGMTMLDMGCAMGFFSLEMAHLGGETCSVICVDMQEKMIAYLLKRAEKSGAKERIRPHVTDGKGLNLPGHAATVDFALAFYMIHEVEEPVAAIQEIYAALKRGGRLLVTEPSFHVTEGEFEKTEKILTETGFAVIDRPLIRKSHTLLLEK